MKKKKTPSSKQRIDARYLANRKQGRHFFGCYLDTLLLQRFLIQDEILPPRIDDYSLAELKEGFAQYMLDIEGFWRDAFNALDQDRKRVRRTIPIAPVWAATSAMYADAFVLHSTRRNIDCPDRLYVPAWSTNNYLSLPA